MGGINLRFDLGLQISGSWGSIARTWWLEVSLLWVAADRRGAGHGGGLPIAAEDEARRRGCHHALLDTFSFQARGFHERQGHRVFGALADFPRGQVRLYLAEAL